MSNNSEKKTKTITETASALNNFLDRKMAFLIPTGVVLGLVFPAIFIKIRPLVPLLFGILTFTGAMKLKARDLLLAVKNPVPVILFLITAHCIMPLAVLFISSAIFRNDPNTVSGFVLLYSVPTAVVSFIWAAIYKGDAALTLAIILLDTLLAPFVVPGTVKILLGTKIMLNMTGMTLSLIYMIVIPTIIGVTMNEISKGVVPKKAGPFLGPLSKICLAFVISANCAAIAPQVNFKSTRLWIIAGTCIALTVLGFSLGKIFGYLGGRLGLLGKNKKEKTASIFFATGLKNISAAMTLVIEFFPQAASLPTVLGVVFQQSICAIMGRLYLGKIPGEKADF